LFRLNIADDVLESYERKELAANSRRNSEKRHCEVQ
jgi:hypothetical protein